VEAAEVPLLPALEGDHPGVDPVVVGPLGPQRARTAERVLGDDRFGGLGLACLVGQLGAVDPPVGIGAVEEAEQAAGRCRTELVIREEGDGSLARVVVEEAEGVVARGEAVPRGRSSLPGRRLAREDPGRRLREGHGRKPRVPEAEVRRADAIPGPAAEGPAQRGDVRDGRGARGPTRCGGRAPHR